MNECLQEIHDTKMELFKLEIMIEDCPSFIVNIIVLIVAFDSITLIALLCAPLAIACGYLCLCERRGTEEEERQRQHKYYEEEFKEVKDEVEITKRDNYYYWPSKWKTKPKTFEEQRQREKEHEQAVREHEIEREERIYNQWERDFEAGRI